MTLVVLGCVGALLAATHLLAAGLRVFRQPKVIAVCVAGGVLGYAARIGVRQGGSTGLSDRLGATVTGVGSVALVTFVLLVGLGIARASRCTGGRVPVRHRAGALLPVATGLVVAHAAWPVIGAPGTTPWRTAAVVAATFGLTSVAVLLPRSPATGRWSSGRRPPQSSPRSWERPWEPSGDSGSPTGSPSAPSTRAAARPASRSRRSASTRA